MESLRRTCMPMRLPSVLYYHPSMASLAKSIACRCGSLPQEMENDHSSCSYGVELKETIIWKKFQDGWPNLFIENVKNDCAGRDASTFDIKFHQDLHHSEALQLIFLGSFHSPDVVFEQMSILLSIPRYLARSFTFILPYFPTATMERVDREGTVATAAVLSRLLSGIPLCARGPCQVVIFDIHALQERFYFTDNIIPRLESAIPLLLRELQQKKLKNTTIAFPDEGAFKRFHHLFNDYKFITCIKIREGNKRIVKIKEGDPCKHHCVIVDDLVMTGGTLIECAKALKENGALSISAFVTHAVFPNNSWKKFNSSLFEKFYITDSLPHANEIAMNEPFKMLSLCDAISNTLLGFDLMQN